MNSLEHFFCSTSLWRQITKRRVLPWLLAGPRLGEHVLEIGAGYGAATEALAERAPRVTALEYDARMLPKLASRVSAEKVTVVQGDAAAMPFADGVFSSAVAILMLHHLPSRELQDQAMREVQRVLRPGGSFFVFEIEDTWPNRLVHYKSTFVPLAPASAPARLGNAGFERVAVDFRAGGYRAQARKGAEKAVSATA